MSSHSTQTDALAALLGRRPPAVAARSGPGVVVKRNQPLRPYNKERRERTRTDENGLRHTYGEYFRFASVTQPCAVCGTYDEAGADHYVPVGRGGRDPANCIPICANHQDRHQLGIDTWQDRYDVDAEQACREAWASFQLRRPKLARKLAEHLPETMS